MNGTHFWLETALWTMTGFIAVFCAMVLFRSVQIRGLMGSDRASFPSGVPKWIAPLGLVLGLFRLGTLALSSRGGKAIEWDRATIGLFWLFFAVFYYLTARDIRLRTDGIDFGVNGFRWSEVKRWGWSEDESKLELWVDSPWKALSQPLPGRPIRVAMQRSAEADAILRELASR